MTAATRLPFADASPADVRAALLPEEQQQFDREYRYALDVAREALTLDELRKTLERWQLVAWSTQSDSDGHRRMLRTAERTSSAGERPAGTVPWGKLKQELGL